VSSLDRSKRTRTNVVAGATGAGKSSLISRLLAQRPLNESWAVLVNDFGRVHLRNSVETPAEGVVIREVAGCICCTAQLVLRTALADTLRRSCPDRLLIEASAAAEPKALLGLLRDRGIAEAIDLRSTLCVINIEQLSMPLYRENKTYREQIASADAIYITGTRGSDASALHGAHAALHELKSAATVVFSESEPLGTNVLDAACSGTR
jgi:G3E family GTPase